MEQGTTYNMSIYVTYGLLSNRKCHGDQNVTQMQNTSNPLANKCYSPSHYRTTAILKVGPMAQWVIKTKM